MRLKCDPGLRARLPRWRVLFEAGMQRSTPAAETKNNLRLRPSLRISGRDLPGEENQLLFLISSNHGAFRMDLQY